jgi:NitT/TauT family transport system permease protein
MFIILFSIWELIVKVMEIPKWLLPGASDIFKAMIVNFPAYWPHIWTSFITILTGFLIAVPVGILLAALVTNFDIVNAALSPYVIFLVTTPLITLVPLLMLWIGFGIETRILTVVIQSFAIINMNACTGFLNVPIIRKELMQSMGANRLQMFVHVIFPTALPDVFTGFRLATIFATTACISAEYVGGNKGLGSQIIKYSQFLKTTDSFACIFYVAVIGIIFYGLVGLVQKRVIRWKT